MSHIAAVRGASVALALALITGLFPTAAGGAGPPRRPAVLDPEIYADHTSGRAIVGFDRDVGPGTIRRLSRAGISQAVVIEAIDAVGVVGPLSSYEKVARWADVTYVDAD